MTTQYRRVASPPPGAIYIGQQPRMGPQYRPPPRKMPTFDYLWLLIIAATISGIGLAMMMFVEFKQPGTTAQFVEWITSGQVLRDAPGMVQDVARQERTVVVEEPAYVPATPPPTPYVPMPTSGPPQVQYQAPNIVVQPGQVPVVVDLVPTAEPAPVIHIQELPAIVPTADYSDVDPWYNEPHEWVAPTPYPTVVAESGIVIQPLPPMPTAAFDALDMAARQAEIAALCAADPSLIFCGTP